MEIRAEMQEHVLSIIVIAGDRPANLERLLDGLCNQTLPADEIVLLHTGSKSISEQLIETYRDRLPLKYFHEPGKKASAARNSGVCLSNGSLLAFLDDNCVPCEKWAEVIVRTFARKPGIQVLQGNMSYGGADRCLHAEIHHADYERWINKMLDNTPGYVNTINARNFAIRGDLVRRFRMPFDERLETNDDVEFYWKLRQEGIRVAFSESMEVRHHPGNGLASLLSQWHRYGIGKGQVGKIQDDFWDHYSVHAKSLKSALSFVLGEARNSWFRELFKDLLKAGRLIDAIRLYPVVVMQRLAFVTGLLNGRKLNVPDYDHFVSPIDLLLVVTNKCNLRCKHCYYHERVQGPAQEISTQDVERVLASLNQDLRTVSMSGGEPFLNDHLVGICRALSEKIHVKNVYIVTNGFDTSRIVHTCERILETARFNLYIRVSLDGLPDTHNRRRRDLRSHARAVETVKRLCSLAEKESRLRVEVQTTIGRDNFDELEALAEFVASELRVFQAFEIIRDSEMFLQNPDFVWTSYGPDDFSTLLHHDQLGKVEAVVRSIYEKQVVNGHFDRYQIDFQGLLIHVNCQQVFRKKRLLPCTAGESIAVILENCDVSICEMTHPVGNLAEFDFDLRRLLEERFRHNVKMLRDTCCCPNSCNTSSSILTARIFQNGVSRRQLPYLAKSGRHETGKRA